MILWFCQEGFKSFNTMLQRHCQHQSKLIGNALRYQLLDSHLPLKEGFTVQVCQIQISKFIPKQHVLSIGQASFDPWMTQLQNHHLVWSSSKTKGNKKFLVISQTEQYMNSMKLVIPLHSLYWSIHSKDESNR